MKDRIGEDDEVGVDVGDSTHKGGHAREEKEEGGKIRVWQPQSFPCTSAPLGSSRAAAIHTCWRMR